MKNNLDGYLEKISHKRIRPSLFSIEEALREAGLIPQKFTKVIIAGTNGKGTTAWILYNILRKNGIKSGVFMSPHLCCVRERIQIEGMISEEEWHKALDEYSHIIKKYSLTYYEVTLLLAYHFFTKKRVNVGIMEVGLGGRWDATNVGENNFVVITGIGLDHQNFLGNRRSEILREKLAIIQQHSQIYLNLSPLLLREYFSFFPGTTPKIVGKDINFVTKGDKVKFLTTKSTVEFIQPIPLGWWRRSFALAFGVAEDILEEEVLLPDRRRDLIPPGRWDIRDFGGKKILLDVAHNPQGWGQLIRNVHRYFSRDPHYVIGVLKDKNWKKIFRSLPPEKSFFIPVGPPERRLSVNEFQRYFPEIPIRESVKDAVSFLPADIVITGSFYTVSQLMCEFGSFKK